MKYFVFVLGYWLVSEGIAVYVSRREVSAHKIVELLGSQDGPNPDQIYWATHVNILAIAAIVFILLVLSLLPLQRASRGRG